MPGEQRLTFDVRMQGAEEVERALARMSASLREMPKGAETSLKDLNKNIDAIVKSLSSLNDASSGLGKLDKSFQQAFGSTQANLVRGLGREIEGMQKEVERLTQKTEKFNEISQKYRLGGNYQRADLAEAVATKYGLQAVAGQSKIMEAQSALERATGGTGLPGYRMGDFGGTILSALGLPNIATPAAAVGAFAWASRNYANSGAANISAIRGYQTQGAREALYDEDPTRTVLRQTGLGPEAQFANRTMGFLDTVFNNIRLVTDQIAAGSMAGGRARTGQRLSDLSVQEYGELQTISGFRRSVGAGLNDAERRFGRAGVGTSLSRMLGGGATLDQASSVINALTRYGVLPESLDQGLTTSTLDYGVTPSMIEKIAQREGYLARQGGPLRAFGRRSNSLGELLDVFGAAGFGSNMSLGAQRVTSEFVSSEIDARRLMGGTSIADVGAGFVGVASKMAEVTGGRLASENVASLAAETSAGIRSGMNTAFDPRRTLTLQTLMGLGFNGTEAEGFIRAGLDKPSTRQAINSILSARGRGRAGTDIVGNALGGRFDEVFGGLEGAVSKSISTDVRKQFPALAAQILTGEEEADVATARIRGQGAYFRGSTTGGRGAVQAPAETTEQVSRGERSKVEQRLAQSIDSLADAIKNGIVGRSKELIDAVRNVENAVKSGRELRMPDSVGGSMFTPITEPGRPGRRR